MTDITVRDEAQEMLSQQRTWAGLPLRDGGEAVVRTDPIRPATASP